MRIKVSSKFSGELTLPTIGHPMKANDIITLKDADAYMSDIQMAVKKEWISFVEGAPKLDTHPTEFPVRNIGKNRLVVYNVVFEKDDMKFLRQDQIDEPEFQKAIDMGLLEVESSKDLIVGKMKTEKEKNEETSKEPCRPEEPTTTMRAWDAQREKVLSKDELSKSQTQHVKQIKVAEDDDGDAKKPKMRRKRKKVTTKKSTGKKRGRPPKALQPVGTVRPEKSADEVDKADEADPAFIDLGQTPEDIDFVDHEQTAERIGSHPKLRERSNEQVRLELDN